MVTVRRRHLGPRARRPVRWAAKTAAAVGVVVIVRAVFGVWAAAVVVAFVALVGLLVGWAAVEVRAFDRRRPSPPMVHVPGAAVDHVVFARALAAVAAAYLSECERAERPR